MFYETEAVYSCTYLTAKVTGKLNMY